MAKKTIALVVLLVILFNTLPILSVHAVESVKEFNGTTETLTLNSNISANGCDGAIYAHDGAKLTINGEGKVHGELCVGEKCGDPTCGYAMAVFAKGEGTEININGGTYTNDEDTVKDPKHVDLIYASSGAKIVINGGIFDCSTPQWTLNCKDKTGSTITVKGGKFHNFDPSNTTVSPEGYQEVIVPEGYKVVKNGEWYEVKKLNDNKEYNAVKETLTLEGEFSANGCDGAIYAHNGAELTIDGNGKVHGELCTGAKCGDPTCGFAMAVYANEEGTTVTINGGTYTNDEDTVKDPKHVDLIYAARGAKIVINGGVFDCSTPQWTLNCKDKTGSTITVKGGRFHNFDPSNTTVSPEGYEEIIIPEDYKVIKDGEWYEVVCAHLDCKEYAKKDATYTETGMEAYWECKLCSKIFADKEAKVEVTDKNSLVIPKLVEVVEGNANITESAFENAIKEAEVIGSSTIVIPAVETEETVTTVTVPVNSLKDVAEENKEISIETSEAIITMDTKTIGEIAKQAGDVEDVKIEVVKVEETALNDVQKDSIKGKEVAAIISAQILAGDKVISEFGGGKITVEIPFVPEENAKGEDYVVVYIADDGKVVEIPTKFVDGKIIVELEHFSEYAIVKKEAVKDNTNNSNGIVKTGDNIVTYISILVVSVLGVAFIVLKKKSIKK